jgi:hypothetical protein
MPASKSDSRSDGPGKPAVFEILRGPAVIGHLIFYGGRARGEALLGQLGIPFRTLEGESERATARGDRFCDRRRG